MINERITILTRTNCLKYILYGFYFRCSDCDCSNSCAKIKSYMLINKFFPSDFFRQ